MTRKEAIEMAQRWAKEFAPSYYKEPFQPHEWVIKAMMTAYSAGFDDGWDESTSRYR